MSLFRCFSKGVLDQNSGGGKRKEEFSFLVKFILKLVYSANVFVLDSVFFFKSSNGGITNCEFKFDSIIAVLDSDI